MKMKEKTVKS